MSHAVSAWTDGVAVFWIFIAWATKALGAAEWGNSTWPVRACECLTVLALAARIARAGPRSVPTAATGTGEFLTSSAGVAHVARFSATGRAAGLRPATARAAQAPGCSATYGSVELLTVTTSAASAANASGSTRAVEFLRAQGAVTILVKAVEPLFPIGPICAGAIRGAFTARAARTSSAPAAVLGQDADGAESE